MWEESELEAGGSGEVGKEWGPDDLSPRESWGGVGVISGATEQSQVSVTARKC